MKIITCQPSNLRFHWELEVLATNLIKLGQKPENIVFLFLKGEQDGQAYVDYFKDTFGIEAHVYEDTRDYKGYIPNIKPWLWTQYLKEDITRSHHTYLYIDSDVILTRLPDLAKFPKLDANHWYCSDTLGYTSYNYLNSVAYADEILVKMCNLAGIDKVTLAKYNENEGGAQWLIKNPTLSYWEQAYQLSNRFWQYFQTIRAKTDLEHIDKGLQTWAAQMYAETFAGLAQGIIPEVSKELEFAWCPDKTTSNPEALFIHNSGDLSPDTLFSKADYMSSEPYHADFSKIDKDTWSYQYVKAIIEAGKQLNK